ncbi:Predicted ATPase [Bradyrhizobium sp. Rc2d]|uniref:AAA family ATPase n=1 Tax=Bradyrhizobium sp. Rc2d TaxID=1855321 RepID=UPI0008926B90|nr:AAA family ATPase [Bradyrhizobium sp. Rc2d]SDK00253.1 Predicted ATPase [Bradyrhizobium sp. Rc2d]
MTRLTSVTIRRFKRIEQVSIPLDDVTLLIGANNSGKSSILQAIHFAVSIAQTARLVGEGVAWRQDTYELSFNPSQLLYSPVADVLSLATGGTLLEPRQSQIEIEIAAEDGLRTTVGLRRGRNRNIAVSIAGRAIGEQLMNLASPFTIYAPGLAGVPKEERFMSPGVVRRIVARGDANLTLRNVLRMLHANEVAWRGFLSNMQSLFPGISIDLEFNSDTDEVIGVYFGYGGGQRFPIDAAGTSILQASQLLAYISLFAPRVLILDEPDSHLHPDNQRLLCDLVSKLAAERGFQAILSTHSRHVLDSLKGRGRVIWLSKGAIVDQPDLTTTAVLLDIGALDSVDYFADGELRCVVATEDTDKDALKAILWSNGFVEQDTEVASYTGCSKVDAAVVLGQFLMDKAQHVKLVVHRDRDYMALDRSNAFEHRLTQAGITPLLTDSNDIESYFLNAEHLHFLNPTMPAVRIQELIELATNELREKSIAAVVNLRTEEAFRRRQSGGAPPNHGEIAVSAAADYEADTAKMRRGKLILGRLKSLIQEEIAENPRIFFPSNHLRSERLSEIAATIWPAA